MLKYKAQILSGCWIIPIEAERETADSVWIKGRRNKKASSYESYFDTFQEARDHCVLNAQNKVDIARRQLELANSHLGNAKGLKELA